MREIRIGVTLGDAGGSDLDTLLDRFRRAEASGFQTGWIPNIFGFDALTLAALAGRVTETLEIGTAVVPTHSRHPLYMAQQALSTQAACKGRFVLGLGPSHRVVIENMLGLSFEKPARHVREYIKVVSDLVYTGKTAFHGETLRVNGAVSVASGGPCPILIGALGPMMRRVCGELTQGTITWMTGTRTLGEIVVPGIRAAAANAGRPGPRVVAGFPVVLTRDPGAARDAASKMFANYGMLPSYRAMLDAEGVADPAELAITGDANTIETAIRGLASAGVTDFNAFVYPAGPDPRAAIDETWELLAQLNRS